MHPQSGSRSQTSSRAMLQNLTALPSFPSPPSDPLPAARPHLLKASQPTQCTITPSKSIVSNLILSLDHISQACIFKGAWQFPGDLDIFRETQLTTKRSNNSELMSQVSEFEYSGVLRGEGVWTQWVTQKNRLPDWMGGPDNSLCPCFLGMPLRVITSLLGGLA